MFKSARVKLTIFYLAILLVFSLTLTLGTRLLAQHEFDSSSRAQRGAVHRLFLRLYSVPPPRTDNGFADIQRGQDESVRRHLNNDVLLINLGALIIGGLLSYWYAGRTLKPIEEAHEAQKRFAADASHELRTPLANLRLENEVFLRGKNFKATAARQLITSNLEEVQRLESLAANLLALTQYEQATLDLAPVEIQTVVDEALAHIARPAEAQAVTTEQDIEPGRILGDAESLVQLLGIILDNAIKYGPAKGTVFIDGHRDDGHYILDIRDQGPGVAEADLPHIFERLYRGDKARTGGSGGYGLGLSLAQEIARLSRATITASNARGGGAIFTIVLPGA